MRPTKRSIRCWCFAGALAAGTWAVPGCAGNSKGQAVAPAEQPPRVVRTLTGFASFYGDGFAGEKTASGEIFNPREMVAAHRTLPLGTRVNVTNLANGNRVTLRVIDRGPYVGRNTIIDVSEGAARRLGFIKEGRVRVRVEVLENR